nr:GPO family capsid scaffolding protein [Halomonas elongata]
MAKFRVATEGATTDGREIKREWIEQMAANYDPAKYGARIWMEHMRECSTTVPSLPWATSLPWKPRRSRTASWPCSPTSTRPIGSRK